MDESQKFNADERRTILQFVRNVIKSQLTHMAPPETPVLPDGKLEESGACFVTLLDAEGELRGCIGNLSSMEPLGDNLRRNALNAAFEDPRFSPLDIDEFIECTMEVSVLSPPRPIASVQEFCVGEHGIILSLRNHRAVFLPQVALEQGWNRETTLKYLSLKAGLAADAWKQPEAKFSVFTAEVFGETD
ncbi:AmmeMemoRadiSam system protein A [Victivallis sp. Marseille-Q1083]|uniref:AmmeMemoRadiSam system protein A n=1 Tax=Victivallis sp. Marseille-Q1083 TaxID=2717288 RepID=UPI00158B9E0A|nr:AmmeMemoRadiSam system protein A [Victivallis sp. Marseille-Q1083]